MCYLYFVLIACLFRRRKPGEDKRKNGMTRGIKWKPRPEKTKKSNAQAGELRKLTAKVYSWFLRYTIYQSIYTDEDCWRRHFVCPYREPRMKEGRLTESAYGQTKSGFGKIEPWHFKLKKFYVGSYWGLHVYSALPVYPARMWIVTESAKDCEEDFKTRLRNSKREPLAVGLKMSSRICF